MIRAIRIIAILAALAAGPALADEGNWTPGSEQDPFSQTYTGQEAPAPERARSDATPCARSCACNHQGQKQAPSNA